MPERKSDYLHVSDGTYVTGDGDELRMLFATRTASAVAVPAPVAQALIDGRIDDIAPDVADGLRQVEALVPADERELGTVLSRQRAAAKKTDRLTYVLLPTSYCNMGCSYCGQEHLRGRLTQDHRQAVVDRVFAGMAEPSTRRVRVVWFGGEPMVGWAVIRSLSEKFVAEAERLGKRYDAHIVTNGSLLNLDKVRALHHECRVRRFDITLDGPARIHDVHRPLKNGKKSFDHITSTLQEVIAADDLAGVQLVLRTNVDVQNIDWVDEYLDTIAGLGFATDRVFMNVAPVYSWGNDVSALELERAKFAAREVAWMRRMRELGLRFDVVPRHVVGALCTAVTKSKEIISSTGNVFSCSEYPLLPEHEAGGGLGKVTSLPLMVRRPDGPFDDWHNAVESGETPCQKCRMYPICGGACPKQWREGNVPCPSYKYNMQERFDLIAELNGLSRKPLVAVEASSS